MAMQFVIELGEQLRQKRVIQNLTQKQVAERAKITLQQYQKFQSNERNLMTSSFRIACSVIEALGMDITEFYHKNSGVILSEPVYNTNGEWHFEKNSKAINEDVSE